MFRSVLKVTHNVCRLCVCLPLAQCFNLTTNLIGQIAQNRCYAYVWRLFSNKLKLEHEKKNLK